VIWRRREPLHERLAREGGLPAPFEWQSAYVPAPSFGWRDEVGIHGLHRPRDWHAVELVDAPALEGDELRFVALPDRTLLIEEGAGEPDLTALADAVERSLEPPYRAEARRREGTTWAVGARAIEVLRIEEEVAGDELALTVHEGRRELRVAGESVFGSLRSLERWAAEEHDSYAVHAERLDGDLWEVRLSPL
jgi:hypothetical protein